MRTDDDHQLLPLLPAAEPGKLRHNRRLSTLIGEMGSLGYEVTLCRQPQPQDATPA